MFSVKNNLRFVRKSLKKFLKEEFKNNKYFCIIYGSYAYNKATSKSDIDILIGCDRFNRKNIKNCVNHILNIHKSLGIKIDEEIPHEKKLLISYNYLSKACKGRGFLMKRDLIIPKIVKSKKYLKSDELLSRFLLDTMVHKHIFVCGDYKTYQQLREIATENLIKIICYTKKIRTFTIFSLIYNFLYNNCDTGDYYLGFEDKQYYWQYLNNLYPKIIKKNIKKNNIKYDKEKEFFVLQKDWIDEVLEIRKII